MLFENIRKSTKAKLKTIFVLTFSFFLTFYPFAPIVFAEDVITPIVEVTSPTPTPILVPEATPTPTPTAVIITGDASAVATAITQTNTTNIDSTIETSVTVVADPTQHEVVPFASSEKTPVPTSSSQPSELNVANEATTSTVAVAIASTGNNVQTNDSTNNIVTDTGDVVAIANSVAVVNTTLINSTVQVGVVDITMPWNGDVLLDPIAPIATIASTDIFGPKILVASNSATITTHATAVANTGENTQIASNSAQMITGVGNAASAANAIVNQTIVDTQIVKILTQNLWLWSGLIYNWQYPGSVQAPSDLFGIEKHNSTCESTCEITNANITNQADVSVSSNAVATTGNNTQTSSGSAEMKTGNAYASATATAIVNSTLINSRLSLLYLMLLAPWTGNLIFAYPDLVTTVNAPESVVEGDPILYQISIANIGHKLAKNVAWQHSISNAQQTLRSSQEQGIDIPAGGSITRTISIDTSGQAGNTIAINVASSLLDPEVSVSNNSARAETRVSVLMNQNEKPNNPIQLVDSNPSGKVELPQIGVLTNNNASNGVYPGDGVAYDVIIANTGSIDLFDTILIQDFLTPEGELLGELRGPIGNIPVSTKKVAHFVLQTGINLVPGTYITKTYAEAKSDQGITNGSNSVENQILLLNRVARNWIGTAVASEYYIAPVEPGEVLGMSDAIPTCSTCRSLPWYLVVAGGSLAYFLATQRKRDFAKVMRWGLAIPLLSYAGLLLTQPECRNGLMLNMNANYWCQWFAVYAYGIYGATAGINGIWRRISNNIITKLSK